jgi:uncharacterized protein YecE (DUF72 family)
VKTALRIGTAGWAIPARVAAAFPTSGSALTRYAATFDAVEINSTFYRAHRPQTLTRWAAATPGGFRFAVKAPRAVTHDARLVQCEDAMVQFLETVAVLGEKLGPLLVQLPPSLAFDGATAERFFSSFVAPSGVVCEPRHASWFEKQADDLLRRLRVARVAADPARHPLAGKPGGWDGLAYWRLHGSPRTYWSSYDQTYLHELASKLTAGATRTWCIFDNTASGAAAHDALALQSGLTRA